MRELVIASDDMSWLECEGEGSHGRFEFARMKEGDIAWEIQIRSGSGISSDDSSSFGLDTATAGTNHSIPADYR